MNTHHGRLQPSFTKKGPGRRHKQGKLTHAERVEKFLAAQTHRGSTSVKDLDGGFWYVNDAWPVRVRNGQARIVSVEDAEWAGKRLQGVV